MKHKKFSKGTVIAASVILVTVVCAVLGISTLRGIENQHIGNVYADNYLPPQDQKRIKANDLKEVILNYDKENIAEAYVFLNDSDGEITNAYITIVCRGKSPDSETLSGIRSLASEALELDNIQNIYVDYIDYELFYSLPQDPKRIRANDLKEVILNYDKENIAEAYVFLNDIDGEITNAHIMIVCRDKSPDSEMLSGIKSLASEGLELDIQNIYVDYIDYESYTSNERVSR